MRMVVLASLLIAAPFAGAGTADDPELTDPPGDVRIDQPGGEAAEAPPWADASDVLSAWFTDDERGLTAHIHVADLASISTTDVGVIPDTMFFVRWQPSYNHSTEVLERTGEWELRADYRPMDDPAWHFWMERPCKDGDDTDGCAGEDRDILDGLDGAVDVENSTVSITAPWWHLEHPRPGDGIHSLVASSQMVWPSPPLYSVDWDHDERATCYLFASLPLDPDQLEGIDDGATGVSHGAASAPYAPSEEDACASMGATSSGPASSPNASSTADTDGAPSGRPAQIPAIGPLLTAAILSTVAVRRRPRGDAPRASEQRPAR